MAKSGIPPLLGAHSRPKTATASEADIDTGARILRHYLE